MKKSFINVGQGYATAAAYREQPTVDQSRFAPSRPTGMTERSKGGLRPVLSWFVLRKNRQQQEQPQIPCGDDRQQSSCENRQQQEQQQIPCGDDRKKSSCENRQQQEQQQIPYGDDRQKSSCENRQQQEQQQIPCGDDRQKSSCENRQQRSSAVLELSRVGWTPWEEAAGPAAVRESGSAAKLSASLPGPGWPLAR